jgi:cyanophycin synthetase
MLITPNPSVEILRDAFEKKGYTYERFELADSTFARFTAPSGRIWIAQGAHIGYPFTHRAVSRISSDKNLAYDFCENEGVRIPKTFQITQMPAESYLLELLQHQPLVVKPYDSSLSRGVTLDITDVSTLRKGIEFALGYSEIALVQEQVLGEEVRFTVVKGKAKAAILRQKPRLIGDGKATLQQLLERENQERAELELPYITYPQLPQTILGDTPADTVLAAGEVFELSRSTMIRTGASIYNVIQTVHPSYLQTVENLAQKLGANFIVVDMILRDYTQEQSANNYAFIEFNTTPVLKLFYSCRDGQHYDVVEELADMIDGTLHGVDKE